MRNSVCVVMPGTVLPLLLILGVVGGAHASSGGAPEPALEESEQPEYLLHMTAGSATYEAGVCSRSRASSMRPLYLPTAPNATHSQFTP